MFQLSSVYDLVVYNTRNLILVFITCFLVCNSSSIDKEIFRPKAPAKKNLFEKGQYHQLIKWIEINEPENYYLRGRVYTKLSNLSLALTNYIKATNQPRLKEYAFYRIGSAWSELQSTNCLRYYERAAVSKHPYIKYKACLGLADYYAEDAKRSRYAAKWYQKAELVLKDLEKSHSRLSLIL